jgi:hypothetical protein
LASLGKYVYVYQDNTLYVNLFIAGTAEFEGLTVEMESDFPKSNVFTLKVLTAESAKINIRIPSYAENFSIHGVDFKTEKGYAVFDLNGSQELRITFDTPARFVWANPAVSADNGRAAVQKGPFVYCFEETDNGKGIASFFADTDAPVTEEWDSSLGVWKITVKGKKFDVFADSLYDSKKPVGREAELVGVPYAVWGNRGPGEMFVWLRYMNI